MKTSAILSTALLSALAAAAPLQQRAQDIKTEWVTETVVVYTTVWEDYVPEATAQPTASSVEGLFYETQKEVKSAPASTTLVVETKPASKETPPAPPASTPPPPPPAPKPAPATSSAAPPPPPPPPAPEKPSTTAEAPAAAPTLTTSLQQAQPAAPSAAPSQAPSSGSGGSGQKYTGEMTIYNAQGNNGACGKPIQDSDMVVALGKPTWGESTYDRMTGESSNPWCGKKINIHYNGKTTGATILDLCPECAAGDIDLTPSLWKIVTGGDPADGGRYKVEWTAA